MEIMAKRLPASCAILLICASLIATVHSVEVKNIGITQGQPVLPTPKPASPVLPLPSPVQGQGQGQAQGKKWCIPKLEASRRQLSKNIQYACSQGVDCKPILKGGVCHNPNNVKTHATYIMNAYYQLKGKNDFNCDFSNSGVITFTDPSYGTCKLQA